MNIHLLCISDSDKHFASAIEEYKKRLGKQLTITHLKPIKHGTREQIIEKETQLLLTTIAKKPHNNRTVYLLSKEGVSYSSESFSRMFSPGSTATIIIGGPYGVHEHLFDESIKKISLGNHTMPHGLATLVLVEQVYRATTLHTNKTYHY